MNNDINSNDVSDNNVLEKNNENNIVSNENKTNTNVENISNEVISTNEINVNNNKKTNKIILIIAMSILVILLVLGYLFKDKIKDFFSKDNDTKINNETKNTINENTVVTPTSDDNLAKKYAKWKYYVGDNPCTSKDPYNFESGDYKYHYEDYYYSNIVNYEELTIDFNEYFKLSGWSVQLKEESNNKKTINSKLCSSINNQAIMYMDSLFSGSNANSIDLSSFDTSNVVDMSSMFYDANIKKIDLSNFNTSNVVNMSGMFFNSNIEKLDLSNFDTSNVLIMKDMFANASASQIIGYENFDTSNVLDMSGLFTNTNIKKIDLSKYKTNKVIYMDMMFYGSKAQLIDASNIDTSNVIDMTGMFAYADANEIKGLETFNTSNVINMSGMFAALKAKNIFGYENFDTSKVNYTRGMFAYSNLENIDVSKYNSSALESASYMFAFNNSKNINVSNFKVPKEDDTFELFFDSTANVIGGEKKECEHDYVKLSEEEKEAFFKNFKLIDEVCYEGDPEIGGQYDNSVHLKENGIAVDASIYSNIAHIYKIEEDKYWLIIEDIFSEDEDGKYAGCGYYIDIYKIDVAEMSSSIIYVDGKKYTKREE